MNRRRFGFGSAGSLAAAKKDDTTKWVRSEGPRSRDNRGIIVIKKLSRFGSAVALIFFASTFSPSCAANRAITMGPGDSSGLLLERPVKTILIGDPNIVDVLERSDRSVIIQALNLGATNVIFLDERSIAIANVRILVCKTATSPIAYGDGSDCGHVNAPNPPT